MSRHLLPLLLSLLVLPSPLFAQDDDEESPFKPGLVATYSQRDAVVAARIEASPALLANVLPADPRFARGNVQVNWQGRLLTQGADNYRLHAYGVGKLSVELGGKEVLRGESDRPKWFSSEPLSLPHDYHPLVVRFSGNTDEGKLRLFWSSDSFSLEPIGAKQLWHEAKDIPEAKAAYVPGEWAKRAMKDGAWPRGNFERGQTLARTARCAACHEIPGEDQLLVGPALDKLAGNMNRDWLIWWLSAAEKPAGTRRYYHQPMLDLFPSDSTSIANLLLGEKDSEPASLPVGERERGKRIFETIGCLACHQVGSVGASSRLGGGDLSTIADKRPASFFAKWLASPAELNRDHRMPTYELSAAERDDLAAYLSSLKSKSVPKPREFKPEKVNREHGIAAVKWFACAACHRMPGNWKPDFERKPWREARDLAWQCDQSLVIAHTGPPRRQAKYLDWTREEKADLAEYVSTVSKLQTKKDEPHLDGASLLAEKQCLACHAREGAEGLAPKLLTLAKSNADLAPLVPALTPPSLIAVGDKLNDPVLLAMMKRMEQPHRDYLHVRMPRFNLSQDELEAMLAYFVHYDRIPPEPPDARARPPQNLPKESELAKAGEKLVVAGAGLSCTSCHAIGKHQPTKAPINARGPNLTNVGFRIREPFFYRWCKNPARIIPGQEMPSVSVPVQGVLKENVDHQLAAVWTVLNTPGFTPKDAGPHRIVRAGDGGTSFSLDALQVDGKTYEQPLVVGLENGHNLLFDFQEGRLARWWQGDAMAQYTKGKSWYWQADAPALLQPDLDGPEIKLLREGEDPVILRGERSISELDSIEYGAFQYRLRFRDQVPERQEAELQVTQTFAAPKDAREALRGWDREILILNIPEGARASLRLVSSKRMEGAKTADEGRTLLLAGEPAVSLHADRLSFEADGSIHLTRNADRVRIRYRLARAPAAAPLPPALRHIDKSSEAPLGLVPGLAALRLPLDRQIMPTAMAWAQPLPGSQIDFERDSSLFVASLEGRLWYVDLSSKSAFPERYIMPAPYGLSAYYMFRDNAREYSYIDILHKQSLVRLRGGHLQTLATGWGYTQDYHDWAVGLIEQEQGYWIALPCQQDQRLPVDAKLRGQVIAIQNLPQVDPAESKTPRREKLRSVSSGHRFPMGIAKNRAGDVFVTDNQGNYNPFNELNHVQQGKDFGFVNANDKGKPKPPLTPPAINIPHPWTRSVNGICFLESPKVVRVETTDPFEIKTRAVDKPMWGPFEGHLIGCEYDTRRLIRMSLQKVGNTYQGACYPFSLEKPKGENFLGPISCAISPRGELYIGSIRDSGWGGGANVGEIVRIEPPKDEKSLPPGIAEVTASKEGFTITFTQPVDAKLAADAKNYSLESFTRESTPAYGGDDKHRRVEKVASAVVAPDRRSVRLKLDELRPGGYVYEFHLKNLADGDGELFPAEAYYTLNVIP